MTTAKTRITAKVERIVFPKPAAIAEEGFNPQCFYIVKCDVGTCKGRLSHVPKAGESLTLDGAWEVSRYTGKPEFSFFHASVFVPADERALLRYACEMTSGFGPAMEQRIWDALGEGWRGVSADIPGLTPAKVAAFQQTIDFISNNSERAKTVSWLVSIGLTANMAESAFEKWGSSTIVRVQEDPYILARLPNHSFADCDRHVVRHFEITRDDARRIDAALKYYLAQLMQEETVVAWEELYAKVSAAIDSSADAISDRCRAMFASGRFVPFPDSASLSSARAYEAELGIFRFAIDSEAEVGADRPHARKPPSAKARQPKARDFDLDET